MPYLTLLSRSVRAGVPGTGASPSIGLSKTTINLSAPETGDPPALADTVTITNVGGGTMSTPTVGTITDTNSIVSSTQITGSGPWTLIVELDRGALAVGNYSATIPIVATNADNTPQNVTANLEITSSSEVVASPAYSLPLNESGTSIGWDNVNDKPAADMWDFRTVPTVTGSTHNVTSTAEFTSALSSCARGDVISIAAGTVITGTFTLPPKSGSGWITIRSANHASLPSVGSRVAASDSSNMFTIRSTSTGATTLLAAATASNWRIIGGIITNESGSSNGSSLVDFTPESNSWNTKANACHDIVFDRCWFKAQSAGQRRGWAPGGYNMAAYGCRFSGFNDAGAADSQAICTWEWVQRLHVENCYLDAATENIMFGGAPQWQLDSSWNDTWPVDIVIGRCEFAKSGSPSTQVWKNMFEVKNGARGVLWGCVIHGARTDAQNQVIIIEANNQGDVPALASYTRAENWTIRGNKFYDCDGDALRVAEDNGTLVTSGLGCNRVEFSYNVLYGWLVSGADAGGGVFQPAGNGIVPDVTIRNNTCVDTGPHSYVYYDDTNVGTYSTFGHSIYNNIFARATTFGWFFNNSGGTSATKCDLLFGSGNWRVDHNISVDSCAVSGGTPSNSGTNSTVANEAAVKFTNAASDDYSLQSDSPAKGAGSDGRDCGCSWSTLQANISGVETG